MRRRGRVGAGRVAVLLLAALAGQGVAQKPSAALRLSGAVVTRDASVERFLHEIERAAESNDADERAELYAERVDRYFLRTDVTRDFVYKDVLDWLSRGRLIQRYRLTVLSEEEQGGERTVLVRKQALWLAGDERRQLSTRSQLVLRRVGGEWKIVSERDYKS